MTASLFQRSLAFLSLFLLYQTAEGLGGRVFHQPILQNGLMLAAFVAAWPVSRWLGYRGLGAFGLDCSWSGLRLVISCLALALAFRFAALGLGTAAGWYKLGSFAPAAPLAFAGVALSTFVPSIAEDILTRGFWLKAAQIPWTGPAYILAASLIFVLNHIYRLELGPLEWLRLFCFGLAYAAAAWRWQTLWAAVGLHWGWNLANGLLDLTLPVDVTAGAALAVTLLSSLTHLVLAGVIVGLPRATHSL